MLKELIFLLFVVQVFGGPHNSYRPKCGYGKRYYKCMPCRKSCKDIHSPAYKCPCKPGCACATGTYWSKHEQKCVYSKYCPKPCYWGQVYYKCLPCKRTCHHLDVAPNCGGHHSEGNYPNQNGGNHPPQNGGNYPNHNGGNYPSNSGGYFPQRCKPGCACPKGYYWNNKKRKCVSPHHCPKKCDYGKVYYKCLPCHESCDDYRDNKYCHQGYCKPGCACPKGTYWSDKENKCVYGHSCPHYCPNNQIYAKRVCCVPKCPKYRTWIPYNPCFGFWGYRLCPGKCTCKPGTYLNEYGYCVKYHKCFVGSGYSYGDGR